MHDSLRQQKTSDCFLAGNEFQNELFVLRAIKCLPNFINHSLKPWNHCNHHFQEFIASKENMSFSLKDNRFNGEAVDKLVQVYNTLEGRNTKETNYEFEIRGKENLNTVSRRWCPTNMIIYWKMPAAVLLQNLW